MRKQKKENNKGDGEIASFSGQTLTVKFASFKGNNLRKRYSRSLRKSYRVNAELQNKNKDLHKTNRRLQKRIERLRKKGSNNNNASINQQDYVFTRPGETPLVELTPRSRSQREFILLNTDCTNKSSRNKSQVRRKLLLANTIIDDIKVKIKEKKKRKDPIHRIMSGLVQKYRCSSLLGKSVGVSRQKISRLIKQRKEIKNQLKDSVIQFLQREGNSTTMPGKKDTKVVEKEVKQRHILSDYMINLYSKFLFENPEIKISKSSFCKMRPAKMLLANFANRKRCLCSRHQNMALMLKAVSRLGVKCSKNPDNFIQENNTNEKLISELRSKSTDSIKFTQWKRVQDGKKLKHKEVEESLPVEHFISKFEKDLDEFREHVERVKNQYREMRHLRENLPKNEILIWMDFAENFGCASVEEVQSAYWNSDMITLHNMIVYYPDSSFQSYVAISDVLSHNATSVYTILRKFIPILKKENPNLNTIHYLTDSPTSQYRNKTMFQTIALHKEEFGVSARWSYLESGHGKGPCDGLGASVKRSAENAVTQNKCSIQSAEDFFKWSSSITGSKIKYLLYTQAEYEDAEKIISKRPVPCAVPGTFKLHFVIAKSPCQVFTRNLSCYCKECLIDVSSSGCTGYSVHDIVRQQKKPKPHQVLQNKDNDISNEIDQTSLNDLGQKETNKQVDNLTNQLKQLNNANNVNEESWVAAMYGEKWYLGQIIEIDETDEEFLINFMAESGKIGCTFKWPAAKDEIWVTREKIIYALQEPPCPVGKSRRMFKITNDEYTLIQDITASLRL